MQATCQPVINILAQGAWIDYLGCAIVLDTAKGVIVHCCNYAEEEQHAAVMWLGVVVTNIDTGFSLTNNFPLCCVMAEEKACVEETGMLS